ncbi:protein of unknown function DUF1659 [Syntrophobotulus glycolicus DSM 8271]|uniref:DUF1659 domain-containing protein n=1 Tax=Syntrophobotulus glycolicus (strain DSM 8271 / FlGlyR) TaxID=645991 RepID=F0SZT6_SYNGF|nr:DUF1659 domain-containing protein [Syntrophobotulus glycolicus]ADY57257.1 protein of unknown function DUF1659 [Syntrophobotulus glycolicus DSM 8271]
MAVLSAPLDSVLTVRYQTGTSAGGSPVIRQKNIGGIKSGAADQDLYEIAQALFSLVDYPPVEIRRNHQSNLIDQ